MKNDSSFSSKVAILCAVSALGACIASRVIFDNPLEAIHIVKGIGLLPPMWLFNLINYAWFFLTGLSAGAIVSSTSRKRNVGIDLEKAYLGGILYISSFFLGLMHYLFFFIEQMLFISVIISFLAMMCVFLCANAWRRAHPAGAAFVMYVFSLWEFYIFFVSLSVFLNN